MKTFETGKTYKTRSLCDYDCVFSYEIVKRTAKTVTIKSRMSGVVSRKIQEYNGSEAIFPEGKYLMAPILTA